MQAVPTLLGVSGHVRGERIPLRSGERVVVGRSRKADISLRRMDVWRTLSEHEREKDEAFRAVSGRHFEIIVGRDQSVKVVNLSPNGTLLNDQRINKAVIPELGDSTYTIRFGREEVFALRSDITALAVSRNAPPRLEPALIGVSGHVKGQRIPLAYGGKVVVGRSRRVEVSLRRMDFWRKMSDAERETDESLRAVSGRHFELIVYNSNCFKLSNLSPNGTFLGPDRVENFLIDDLSAARPHMIRFGRDEVLALRLAPVPAGRVPAAPRGPEPETTEATLPAAEPPAQPKRRRRFSSLRAVPWWVASFTLHSILLFISMLIVVRADRMPHTLDPSEAVFVNAPPPRQEEVILDAETPRYRPNIKTPDTPLIFSPERLLPDDRRETENEELDDLFQARGHENAVSSIPASDAGHISFFGVRGFRPGGAFGWRLGSGNRRRQALKHGGSRESESAVNLGLKWLMRNQDDDGCWSAFPTQPAGARELHREGVTGLALLAFLGAGHTDRHGKYSPTVRKGLNYLMDAQDGRGLISGRSGSRRRYQNGYNHAIGALALAEAFGMGKTPRVGKAAQKAVDWSVNHHQHRPPGGGYSGWRYLPGQAPDTSVTGWFVMQLKSAKVSGLKVPGFGFRGALNWLDMVQPLPKPGRAYDGLGRAGYRPDSSPSPSMTSVAMVCRQFLGHKPSEGGNGRYGVLACGAAYLRNHPPRITSRGVNFYYLYYGTLAMFQMGGENWKIWNGWMRDPLIAQQVGSEGVNQGSWNPEGDFGRIGGRVYSTAMAVLSLEVYYRYLPMYQ